MLPLIIIYDFPVLISLMPNRTPLTLLNRSSTINGEAKYAKDGTLRKIKKHQLKFRIVKNIDRTACIAKNHNLVHKSRKRSMLRMVPLIFIYDFPAQFGVLCGAS